MARVFTITEGLENLGALKTGGQGSVYKGRRLGEIFTAVKIIPTPIYSETNEDKNFVSFQNEVQKLKKVNENPNPNVVAIVGSGITDSGNFPYIEMEFIEGPDLEELLQLPDRRVFTIKEIIKVADQLSNALAHCHNMGVRHGDIKSNNVKYNIRSGNYVLLDFGLAVMSDEQRRTSFRHAGAIEFMAPEQNEGQMLPQTDVYSFGVIIFELIAGTVPFPLKDKGETARNAVMLAHLESVLPDPLLLRQQNLVPQWASQYKNEQMQVPVWLLQMVRKCLEKEPGKRFASGVELHDFICLNAVRNTDVTTMPDNDRLVFLEQEVVRLQSQNNLLLQQLGNINQQVESGKPTLSITKPTVEKAAFKKSGLLKNTKNSKTFYGALAAVIVIIAVMLYLFLPQRSGQGASISTTPQLGIQYKVMVPRAYFHNQPNESTRRNAYAVATGQNLTALQEKDGFIYTTVTNEKGQTTNGWIKKEDLKQVADREQAPVNEEVQRQLDTARHFIERGKSVEALIIYNTLQKRHVAEAMFEYANLALQNKNPNLTCNEAFQLLKQANDKDYIPARRMLGVLYTFANNEPVMKMYGYDSRCNFPKNVYKGSKLLMEATLLGDTAAARWLDELDNLQQ